MSRAAATILVVDDKPNMLRLMTKVLRDIAEVHTADSGASALAALEAESIDVVLCDLKMPDLSGLEVLAACKARQPAARFILMTAYATVETAVAALKDGAFDYLTKPFEPDEAKATILRALHSAKPRTAIAEEDELLPGVHARSELMTELAAVARQISPTDISVLIRGESGTGRETLARAIHQLSPRRDLPFYHLDCGATQDGRLVEAVEREAAGQHESLTGTLFLAEVDALGSSGQTQLAQLLGRARQSEASQDLRVIASAQRDLDVLVTEGVFRRDLRDQLRVVALGVPPLRKRREDIPVLAAHLLSDVRPEEGATVDFTAGAMERLSSAAWPGNVRELRSVIEHAAALAGNESLSTELLPDWIRSRSELEAPWTTLSWSDALARGRADVARRYLVALLRRFDGDVVKASSQAKVERESFYRLLRKHGIQPDGFRREGREAPEEH